VAGDGFHAGISGSLREFLHALDTGETPNGDATTTSRAAMVFGAIASAKTQKRVRIVGDTSS